MSQRRKAVIPVDRTKPATNSHDPRWARVDAGPLGAIFVAYGETGVRRIDFDAPTGITLDTAVPAWLREPFEAYFAGKPIDLRVVPVDPVGTPFQKRVWDALARIPHGRVVSYGQIAKQVGSPRGMRAVGMANGHNPIPILLPCHRVVESGGKLGGYSGGLDKKIALLALEGVVVESGRVLPGQLDLFGPAAA